MTIYVPALDGFPIPPSRIRDQSPECRMQLVKAFHFPILGVADLHEKQPEQNMLVESVKRLSKFAKTIDCTNTLHLTNDLDGKVSDRQVLV